MEEKIKVFLNKHKWEMTAGIITGIITYGFMLANKIPNHDDLTAMFGVGATVTSGRWCLELIKRLFGNCLSIPWLNGFSSVTLLTLGAVLTTEIFDITGNKIKCLLSAAIVSFPSFLSMMTYMFTAPAFSLAFLFATVSTYLIVKEGGQRLFIM